MELRFKQKKTQVNIGIISLSIILSVSLILYGVFHFGLGNEYTWLTITLSACYLACVTMICMYLFNVYITMHQFNYWCSISLGITVLLRDILFITPLFYYPIHLGCLTLSVLLLCMLTYFYAQKEWRSYTKQKLWMIFIVDMLIATLYNIDILLEPTNEYTAFFVTEIWIRPTISYGLVVCFVSET